MMFDAKLFNYFVYNQFGGENNRDIKWDTFSHNGVLFPEPYKPHKQPLIYDGKSIILDEESEEYATIYAKFIETDYVKNSIFNKNFFNDWKIYLKKGGFKEIAYLSKCDFSHILNYIIKLKEKKLIESKEDKDKQKKIKENYERKFTIAQVDGKDQPVGNFRIEPPGIFLGRGCHPKIGKIKKRIYPEDITINIDNKAQIPPMPKFYIAHKWNKIIHDNTLEWIASWKDNITGKVKYVWLGAKSDFKAKSDENKFDVARKLNPIINSIRSTNIHNLISKSTDVKTKQLATALYLIDNLALRVGNEKGENEADTVGVCSLRVEHITLLENNEIKLDFLGKDSVQYLRTVIIEPEVYRSIILFVKNKKASDDLFDLIDPPTLNNYLKTIMPDLTAKVFRTYNASKLFQEELLNIDDKIDELNGDTSSKINLILDLYNKANIKVALLCNHQKQISKSFNEQLNKINSKIKELKIKKKDLEKEIDIEKNSDKSSKEKIKKIKLKIKKIQDNILSIISKKELKIELKNLSLGTSKTNYIDPRITVAFLKKHNLPLEKIFSQALIDKFFWAMDVDKNWIF